MLRDDDMCAHIHNLTSTCMLYDALRKIQAQDITNPKKLYAKKHRTPPQKTCLNNSKKGHHTVIDVSPNFECGIGDRLHEGELANTWVSNVVQ